MWQYGSMLTESRTEHPGMHGSQARPCFARSLDQLLCDVFLSMENQSQSLAKLRHKKSTFKKLVTYSVLRSGHGGKDGEAPVVNFRTATSQFQPDIITPRTSPSLPMAPHGSLLNILIHGISDLPRNGIHHQRPAFGQGDALAQVPQQHVVQLTHLRSARCPAAGQKGRPEEGLWGQAEEANVFGTR